VIEIALDVSNFIFGIVCQEFCRAISILGLVRRSKAKEEQLRCCRDVAAEPQVAELDGLAPGHGVDALALVVLFQLSV
jgi:hypothetical protein